MLTDLTASRMARPGHALLDQAETYSAGMTDILLGLFAVIAGVVMLFAGQFVLRLVLSIWGFFAGFAFGSGLFAALADERVLGTLLGWVCGFVFAVIFAVLAYLYFAVAVVLAMAAFGFAIGAGIVVALGVDWNWVAILAGLTVGAVLGLLSVFANLPMVVLALVSSVAGAASVVGGLMLLFGSLSSADFTQQAVIDGLQASWGWSLTLLVLAVVGFVSQIRQRVNRRRTVSEAWYVERA